MDTTYATAIIAGAVVILVVVILLRGRLTRGRLSLTRDKIDAEFEAQPGQTGKGSAATERPLQPGKTVADDTVLGFGSSISAPPDTDLKVRRSKLFFGSKIEIRDAPAKKGEIDD